MDCHLPSRCLICYRSKSEDGRRQSTKERSFEGELFSNTLSSQLQAVFILRNVLEIPKEEVSRYLQRVGGSCPPDRWIWTCLGCGGLVNKARKLHELIVISRRRLGVVKKRIIERVKKTREGKRGRRPNKFSSGDEITNSSRSFVFKHNYDIVVDDPFQEGDLKASQVVLKAGNTNTGRGDEVLEDASTPIVVKQEEEGGGGEFYYEGDEDPGDFQDFNVEPVSEQVFKPEEVEIAISPAGVMDPENILFGGEQAANNVSEWSPKDDPDYEEETQRNRRVRFQNPAVNLQPQPHNHRICLDCGAKLSDKYKLKRHMMNVHKKVLILPTKTPSKPAQAFGPVKVKKRNPPQNSAGGSQTGSQHVCGDCGAKLSDKYILKRHIMTKHLGISLQSSQHSCGDCGAKFCYRYRLKRHMMNVHKKVMLTAKQPTECELCGKKFRLPCKLKRHIESHHKKDNKPNQVQGRFLCDLCNERFTRKEHLQRHLARKHEVGGLLKFPCTVEGCNKVFFDPYHLNRHAVGVHKVEVLEGGYQCEQCGEAFSTEILLSSHIIKKHENGRGKREFDCSQCGKKFNNKWKFRKHEESHAPKSYNCDQCSESCPTSNLLRKHKAAEHPALPDTYLCDLCPLSFSKRGYLTKHLARKHKIWERKNHPRSADGFICSICDKKFNDKWKLSRHEKSHEPKPRHECKICGKVFVGQTGNFLRHVRTHAVITVGEEMEGIANNKSSDDS